MTVHCATSAVLFTALATAAGAALPPAEPSFWPAVGRLVVLATLGGYGLYRLVLRRSGVTAVSTLMFLMAPVTAVWGALVFGEPFGAQTAVGLVAGLAAVVIVRSGHGDGRGGGGKGGGGDGDGDGARHRAKECSPAEVH